jgi:hypothetical protein
MNYTGIGSRQTPEHVINIFKNIGYSLAKKNIILRSGHADGADIAFEYGCDKCNSNLKEIYIPWKNFNGSNSDLIVYKEQAFDTASRYHPNWYACSPGARKLHARNVHQILGWEFDNPSDFVICYTDRGLLKGGTSLAINIAADYNIPIFNIGLYSKDSQQEALVNFIKNILERY